MLNITHDLCVLSYHIIYHMKVKYIHQNTTRVKITQHFFCVVLLNKTLNWILLMQTCHKVFIPFCVSLSQQSCLNIPERNHPVDRVQILQEKSKEIWCRNKKVFIPISFWTLQYYTRYVYSSLLISPSVCVLQRWMMRSHTPANTSEINNHEESNFTWTSRFWSFTSVFRCQCLCL